MPIELLLTMEKAWREDDGSVEHDAELENAVRIEVVRLLTEMSRGDDEMVETAQGMQVYHDESGSGGSISNQYIEGRGTASPDRRSPAHRRFAELDGSRDDGQLHQINLGFSPSSLTCAQDFEQLVQELIVSAAHNEISCVAKCGVFTSKGLYVTFMETASGRDIRPGSQ